MLNHVISMYLQKTLHREFTSTNYILRYTIIAGIIALNSGSVNAANYRDNYDNKYNSSEIQALRLGSFLSSLGICIHHAQGVRVETYIEPLKYLGIRNIRDDFGNPEGYIELRKRTGVRTNMIANTKSLNETISTLETLAKADALLSVEGPNEPNNFPIFYNGHAGGGFHRLFNGTADWSVVAEFQRDLYSSVKSNTILAKYPVFNVSEVGAQYPNVGLQFLSIPLGSNTTLPSGTKFADFLNVHNYVSGTRGRYEENQAWKAAAPGVVDGFDGLYANHGKLWGHNYTGYTIPELEIIPKVTTETGWDSKSDHGGEAIQGKVLLNTYLSQYKRGWSYTFIYMLRDGEGGAGNQGVFNSDSSPKLAAHYIHRMTQILSVPEDNASLRPLEISLSNHSDAIHNILLQGSDKEYFLLLWGERVSGEENITVSIGEKFSSVDIFDPTVDISPIKVINGQGKLEVTLSDHPLILKIRLK